MKWQTIFFSTGLLLSSIIANSQNHSIKLGCLYANDLDGEGFYYNEFTQAGSFGWSHFSSIEYAFGFNGEKHSISVSLDGFDTQNRLDPFKTNEKHLATIHKPWLGLIQVRYLRQVLDYEGYTMKTSVGIVRRGGTGTLGIHSSCFGPGFSSNFVPLNSSGLTLGLELKKHISKTIFCYAITTLAYYSKGKTHRKVVMQEKITASSTINSVYFKWGVGYQFSKRSED